MDDPNYTIDSDEIKSTANPPRRCFQWRALTSVVVAFSFLVLGISGGVLWAAPPGRKANWTDWAMLGLIKSDWIDLHLCFGLLFVVASIFHIVLNWRPLLSYFKNKITHQFGLRWEWLGAVVFCAAFFAAVRLELPPFSSFLAFTGDLRESWAMKNERPPIPHAELLTLRELAEKAGVELTNAMTRLKASGIKEASPDISMAELAKRNHLPAQRIYDLMVSSTNSGEKRSGQGQGGRGGGGAGRKTLSEFCLEEGIDIKTAMDRLASKGLKASAGQTLREIAVNNGYEKPVELVRIVRGN